MGSGNVIAADLVLSCDSCDLNDDYDDADFV
jgi:hypothetical protein